MSDAAVRVDPDFYNRRLLGADASVQQNSQGGYSAAGGGGNSMRTAGLSGDSGGIMGQGGGGGGYSAPDLPDYLVRQHSLLGFYLSLSPRDEGASVFSELQEKSCYQIIVSIIRYASLYLYRVSV